MSSSVEQIKARLSIADVVGSYVTLEKAGRNFKARCPFHNEKTPSFFVSPDRQSYYCFGCSAKGDIFTFVQEFEGIDFRAALKLLAGKAGVTLPSYDPKEKSDEDRLKTLMDAAALFYQQKLSDNNEALGYLRKRGLTDESMAFWRIGYAPDEWRTVSVHLKEKGFTEAEIERAGITKKGDSGRVYDRFRNRIMFPITDSSGNVVAFSGRILGKEDEGTPKYLNSPETPLFVKSNILYGFDKAKQDIRRLDYVILVEGQMDLVMSHQAGFHNTVASSGTALTEEQLALIARLTKRIMMVYDADAAGVNASLRSAALALAKGFDVKVTTLPKGTDPAELLRTDSTQYRERLAHATHIIEFYLRILLRDEKDRRSLGKAIQNKLLPFIAALQSAIERAHFVSLIAKETGISESAIQNDLSSVKPYITDAALETASAGTSRKEKEPRKDFIIRLFFGVLFWQEGLPDGSIDIKPYSKRAEKLLGNVAFKALEAQCRSEQEELAFQAESYYAGADVTQSVEELLSNIEEGVLKEEVVEVMKRLSEAEARKDKAGVESLLAQYQDLSTRLSALKAKREG